MGLRLTSLFLILALTGGIFAGAPAHSEKAGMTACCDNAKQLNESPQVNAAQLCCKLNCSEPAPTSSTAPFNAAPAMVVQDSIVRQIAALLKKQALRLQSPSLIERVVLQQNLQPKYLQHHSFLI